MFEALHQQLALRGLVRGRDLGSCHAPEAGISDLVDQCLASLASQCFDQKALAVAAAKVGALCKGLRFTDSCAPEGRRRTRVSDCLGRV